MALTAAQLTQLQQRLQARRMELRGLIQRGVEDAGRERQTGEVYDSGDVALTDLQVDMDLAVGDLDFEEMLEIDAALTRMADGVYGLCIVCGVEIPLARLQSQPAAGRCINCQDEMERRRGRETHRL